MKKVKFIIEKLKDGYSAWNEDLSNGIAANYGRHYFGIDGKCR